MSRLTLAIFIVWALAPLGIAQSRTILDQQLKGQLQGQTVLVRGFYEPSKLHYDKAGRVLGEVSSGPWTLFGYVHLDKVALDGEAITIEGQRVSITFKGDVGKSKSQEVPTHERVEIQIDAPSGAEQGIPAAIARVFVGKSEELADNAPSFWQRVLRGADYVEAKETANGTAVGRVGAGNGPPRILLNPDPEYTEEAKKAKYQGTVVLSGTVDTDGRMKDIQLVRPVGLGLDEKAVAAAQSCKFDPSTHKGKPVPVRIAIEINFHLY